MELSELIEYIDRPNIADEVDNDKLGKIAERVVSDYEDDWDTMSDWCRYTAKGMELIKPPTEGRSEPWEGASNFKSPIIQEATYKFGERASRELLRPKDLVKTEIIGTVTPEKEQSADNVSTYQSYQVNYEIPEWRTEQRQLFYQLPCFGTIFKDTYFDRVAGHLVSEAVHWPNFAVDQAATCVDKLPRFTKIRHYEDDDIHTFVTSDLWLDVDLGIDPEKNEKDQRRFLEQYTTLDLDDDGYGEPYCVTVHQESKKVVRIVPLFTLKDITVKRDDEFFTMDTLWGPLQDEFGVVEEKDEDGEYVQAEGFEESIAGLEIVSIQRNWNISKYGFMPSIDGTFLDVGYFQLLAALVEAVNSGTNQLFDAGTLENLSGGFLAQGMRKKMGRDRFKPGQWKQTDVKASDLQQSLLAIPTKPPSATLLQLVETYKADARQLSASADISQLFGPNTQASTALAMLDEAMAATTALLMEVGNSMSAEFQVMYRLNGIYMDPELYKTVLDDRSADYAKDFNQDNLSVACTANPEYSHQARRLQVAQIMIGNIDQMIANGADGNAIVRGFVEAISPDDVDEIVPPPTEDFMTAQTNAQNQAAQASQAQAEWFTADAAAKNAKAERDRAAAQIDMAKMPEELEKLKSETLLNLEKAETEQATNQISVYTTQLKYIENIQNAVRSMRDAATPDPRTAGGAVGGDVIPFSGTPNIRGQIQ